MATSIVIPYLLGVTMLPNRTIDEGHLEYTFQVNINWWFTNFTSSEENIHLSVELKCHEADNDMACRFENYKVMQQTRKERYLLLWHSTHVERTTDEEALAKDSRPFRIMYSSKGVDGYVVEDGTISKRMMDLYRVIGNQLHIGVDMKGKENFESWERSNIGICAVRYSKIRRRPAAPGLIANLTSLVDFDLVNSKITVRKTRKIPTCLQVARNSVTTRFWPDFFPKTATSHILTKSDSSMTMSTRSFKSVTENEFNLYDKNERRVAKLSENVELYLKSYRLLRPGSLITLNEKNTVFYNVLNDETA